MQLRHDISTAWRRGPRVWRDLLTASWELARANIAFRRLPVRDLPLLLPDEPESRPLGPDQRALVERVAYAVPIMGLRVPWRSDCVVQALAASRWLEREGVGSAVCIGVRTPGDTLEAHAWLKVGERIVTGGDISTYAELPRIRTPR